MDATHTQARRERPRRRRAVRSLVLVVVAALSASLLVTVAPAPPAAAIDTPSPECQPYDFDAATGRALTPQRHTVIQVEGWGGICELERQVIAEIAAERGVPVTAQVTKEIMSYARGEVRTRLYDKLVTLSLLPASGRSPIEQGAIDWMDKRLREQAIAQAQTALDEYDRWKRDPCAYDPPGEAEYNAGLCGGFDLLSMFGDPAPPSYEEFITYGLSTAYDNLLTDASDRAVAEMAISGVSLTLLAAYTYIAGFFPIDLIYKSKYAAAVVGEQIGEATKYALRSARSVFQSILLGAKFTIILDVILIAIDVLLFILDFVERAQIRPQLVTNRQIAEFPFPDRMRTLLQDPKKQNFPLLVFIDATTPEPDPYPEAAPADAPSATTPWFRINAPRLTGFEPTYSQKLNYIDPVEGEREAWLLDRWWVTRPVDGSGPAELTPQLHVLGPHGPTTVRFDGSTFTQLRTQSGEELPHCPSADICSVGPAIEFGQPSPKGLNLPELVNVFATLSNTKPTNARIVAAQSAYVEDEEYSFKGAADDAGGDPLTLRWEILQDGDVVRQYTGDQIFHRFGSGGDFVVRLIASDATGLSDSVDLPVSVASHPTPVIEVKTVTQYPGQVQPGVQPLLENSTNGTFRVTGQPGDVVALDVDVDGTYEQVGVVQAGQQSVEFPAPAYPDEGLYPVRVRVVTPTQTANVDVVDIKVVNVAPTMEARLFVARPDPTQPAGFRLERIIPYTLPPVQIPEGSVVAGSIRVFDEPGDDALSYALYWADGTFERVDDIAEGVNVPIRHVFDDDGKALPYGPFLTSDGLVAFGFDEDFGFASSPSDELSGRFGFDVVNVAPQIKDLDVTVDGARARAAFSVSDVTVTDIESVVIDWGDGTAPEELVVPAPPNAVARVSSAALGVEHDYAAAGDFTVTVTVTDDHPEDAVSATHPITTTGPAPTFDTVVSGVARQQGEATELDITFTDPDDEPAELAMVVDWGDGTTTEAPYDPQTQSFPASHVYDQSGEFTITVSARDPLGNTSDGETFTALVGGPPIVTLDTLATSIAEGSTFGLAGSVTSDDGATVAVSWGDGTTSAVDPAPDGTFAVDHVYAADDGAFTIGVTATDDGALTSTPVTHGVTVQNVDPSIASFAATDVALPTETVTASGSFTDPGALDAHTVTIDWGDGTAATAATSVQHRYAEPGSYTVTFTVTDDDGGVATATDLVVVDALVARVLGIAATLRTKLAGAPGGAKAALEDAIRELDGSNKDAADQLAAERYPDALNKLRNAVNKLYQANENGADVQPEILAVLAVMRAAAVSVIDDAEARRLVSSGRIAKARETIAEGDIARAGGLWLIAADAYRSSIGVVRPKAPGH